MKTKRTKFKVQVELTYNGIIPEREFLLRLGNHIYGMPLVCDVAPVVLTEKEVIEAELPKRWPNG